VKINYKMYALLTVDIQVAQHVMTLKCWASCDLYVLIKGQLH